MGGRRIQGTRRAMTRIENGSATRWSVRGNDTEKSGEGGVHRTSNTGHQVPLPLISTAARADRQRIGLSRLPSSSTAWLPARAGDGAKRARSRSILVVCPGLVEAHRARRDRGREHGSAQGAATRLRSRPSAIAGESLLPRGDWLPWLAQVTATPGMAQGCTCASPPVCRSWPKQYATCCGFERAR